MVSNPTVGEMEPSDSRTCVCVSDPGHQRGDGGQQGEEVGQRRSAALVSDEDGGVRVHHVRAARTTSPISSSSKVTSCEFLSSRYPNVNIHNFSTSWRDGMAFNAIIHKHRYYY